MADTTTEPTASDAVPPPAAEDTRREVREAAAKIMGITPEEIDDDANLVMLGLGSLQVMRMSSRWRRAGTPVDFDTLVAEPTVRAWAAHVAQVRAAAGEEGAA
ncbi:hypothetical protein RVR_7041 [Actinacidiphila reveromycinica]|uniref:Carrier domain-containing protein n=1 Tax=Actinacidiphila reveromycinica TaxID=659352 RepID=A0A7U3VQW6_9ACTN|nr:phosphopantetheine-binding protein [Streptomyces sp. SN-593]BBB00124.1 hypothetical protein RVR_7041 [Streptomyces sp. SN-593]